MSRELREMLAIEREPDPLDQTIRASEIDIAVCLYNLMAKKEEGKGNGKCQECSQPISQRRLIAIPNALRCTPCQARWERENLQ